MSITLLLQGALDLQRAFSPYMHSKDRPNVDSGEMGLCLESSLEPVFSDGVLCLLQFAIACLTSGATSSKAVCLITQYPPLLRCNAFSDRASVGQEWEYSY